MHKYQPTLANFAAAAICLLATTAIIFSPGCQIASAVGGMAASQERNKIVDIPAQYTGLEQQRVAVLIDAPMDIQYEHPNAVPILTEYLSLLIAGNCTEAKVIPTRDILNYLNHNVYWPMMDYKQLVDELGVDRIVMVDLIEYRLFEQGNSYYWDGRIVADINVFEAEGVDSTDFGFSQRIRSRYPPIDMVARHQLSASQVEIGLQKTFAQSTARLFHDHQRKNAELIDEALRNR